MTKTELPPLPDHPEPHSMQWTALELAVIEEYGEACARTAIATLTAEVERLNAALRYEQHRAERMGTHGPGCWRWGPAHYECAAAEVESAKKDAERYRWLRDLAPPDVCIGMPCVSDEDDGSLWLPAELDAAIDSALTASMNEGEGA